MRRSLAIIQLRLPISAAPPQYVRLSGRTGAAIQEPIDLPIFQIEVDRAKALDPPRLA